MGRGFRFAIPTTSPWSSSPRRGDRPGLDLPLVVSIDRHPIYDDRHGQGSPDRQGTTEAPRLSVPSVVTLARPALILSSLAEGEKHGYALTKDIEAFAGVRLAPGTLYEALARLEGQGFIEALESHDRRLYRLSAHRGGRPSAASGGPTAGGRRRPPSAGRSLGDGVTSSSRVPGAADSVRRAERLLRWYPASWRGTLRRRVRRPVERRTSAKRPRCWRRTADVVGSALVARLTESRSDEATTSNRCGTGSGLPGLPRMHPGRLRRLRAPPCGPS